jgi:hypothetical protein
LKWEQQKLTIQAETGIIILDEQERVAVEETLRKRVADCKIFLENTRSFPPRQAAIDAYAEAVQALDNFLSSTTGARLEGSAEPAAPTANAAGSCPGE